MMASKTELHQDSRHVGILESCRCGEVASLCSLSHYPDLMTRSKDGLGRGGTALLDASAHACHE